MKRLTVLLTVLLLVIAVFTPVLAEGADATEVTNDAAETVADAADATADADEQAEEPESEAGKTPVIISKLLEQKWYTWVVVALLLVMAVALTKGARNSNWTSRCIAMGAMCIAIAFVLSCIRLYRMPQGGSITPACMLPLILFMLACGPVQGLLVGVAYGLLQLLSSPYVIHPIQLLVDYPLAFGAMIIGCAASLIPVDKRWKLPIAVLLGAVGRYFMASLSGAVFFSDVAGSAAAWKYSLVYNLSYLGPDTLVCMIVACIPGMTRLVDIIKG
ncbi:MAG: energy-coupled thiamine transporter ThiT [Clostridia bacterium]|nr:energy-coupled thiamine transporter ThiT [Clostridia bacterium]